eukprot:6176655-Pleurochrysis_carterae.AAC.6
MNQVLLKFGQKWSFTEQQGQRDTRPSGNESRALLTLRGLLRELLCVRYGEAVAGGEDEAALHDLGSADTRHIDAAPIMSNAAAQQSHTAGSKKGKHQRTVVTEGGHIQDIASSHRLPPPPPPPPPSSPPPQPQSAAADLDEVDLGDDEEDAEFAEFDVAGDE